MALLQHSVKDPQGHVFQATEAQLEAGASCKQCGWTCTMRDVVVLSQETPSDGPEPSEDDSVESDTEA